MFGETMIESVQMPQGARYEINVDGTMRTHRDKREMALEAANVLKALHLWTGAEIDPQKL